MSEPLDPFANGEDGVWLSLAQVTADVESYRQGARANNRPDEPIWATWLKQAQAMHDYLASEGRNPEEGWYDDEMPEWIQAIR